MQKWSKAVSDIALLDSFIKADNSAANVENDKVIKGRNVIVQPEKGTYWKADVKDLKGRIQHLMQTVRRLKREKEAINNRNRETLKSNENLEQFAYIISHDLREPLRTITSFGQILERRHSEQLGSPFNEYLEIINCNCNRIDILINDLVSYIRLDSYGLKQTKTDLNTCIASLQNEFRDSVEKYNINIEINKELPVIKADAALIKSVFHNIISNCVYFRKEVEDGVDINISYIKEGSFYKFTLRDNGKFIDQVKLEKLFCQFSKDDLYDPNSFGVGMAFCKKIVEMHKGRIWARSDSENGTEYNFTIPLSSSLSHQVELENKAYHNWNLPDVGRDISKHQRMEMSLTAEINHLLKEIKSLEMDGDKIFNLNQDLVKFAELTSTVIREPLRTISNFTGLIKAKYKDTKSNQFMYILNEMQVGVSNMDVLMRDLMKYVAVGSEEQEKEEVNLTKILLETQSNLNKLMIDTKAHISSDILPTVEGHKTLIGLVFQNLIKNAIKYRDGQPPRIVISAQDLGDKILLSFKDNGIGIPENQQDRVFKLFSRLDRKRKDSTGIGLAICKKVVESHGGEIAVKSVVGAGSNFYFTLNKT